MWPSSTKDSNLSDAARQLMDEVEESLEAKGAENPIVYEKQAGTSSKTSNASSLPENNAAAGQQQQEKQPRTRMLNTLDPLDILKDDGMSDASSSTHLSVNASLMKDEEETFYSAKPNEHGDDNIWGLLSGVAGNVYEWYDFAVYGLLSSEIGASFFPTSSKQLQLINSFGVFLAAFFMRPIGAIVFGEIGDRLFGRKHALMASIFLITVPSVLMGLLPTYEMIGPSAPIFLIILRMMQGLSVGGQLAGSYVLSIEQSTSLNRGFRGSICDASSVGGFVLASLVTTCVRNAMPDQYAMEDWGWRVPFLISLALSPILYFIVSRSEESKFWSERTEQKETEKVIREVQHVESTPAVMDLLRSPFRRRQLMGMVGVMSAKAASFYTLFVWTPVYISELRQITTGKGADIYNLTVVSIYMCLLVMSGRISDKFPHRSDLMKIGTIGVIFAAPIMFAMFESESKIGYFVAELQYAICLSFFQGGIAAWEVELWMADPSLSFTGVAMGHNISACVFGGTTPLVATCLYYFSLSKYDDPYSTFDIYFRIIPGLYISFLGCISLYCINFVIRHPHDIRTGEKQMRQARLEEQKRRRRKERKVQAMLKEVGSAGYGNSPTSTCGMDSAQDANNQQSGKSYLPPIS